MRVPHGTPALWQALGCCIQVRHGVCRVRLRLCRRCCTGQLAALLPTGMVHALLPVAHHGRKVGVGIRCPRAQLLQAPLLGLQPPLRLLRRQPCLKVIL